MFEGSLRIIDTCTAHRLRTDHNRNVTRTLTMEICPSLAVDARHREEAVAEEIGACLDSSQGIP